MPRTPHAPERATLPLADKRAATPAQSRCRESFFAIAHAYKAQPATVKARWLALAAQMPLVTGRRTRNGVKQTGPMSAQQCFTAVNGTLLACQQPLNPLPPPAPVWPGPLPPLALNATLAGATFSLTLGSPGYAHRVQIYAAAPLLAGQDYTLTHAFSVIATALSLPDGFVDLTALYTSRFGAGELGHQIPLVLVPVSAQGFKGPPLNVWADVAVSA